MFEYELGKMDYEFQMLHCIFKLVLKEIEHLQNQRVAMSLEDTPLATQEQLIGQEFNRSAETLYLVLCKLNVELNHFQENLHQLAEK